LQKELHEKEDLKKSFQEKVSILHSIKEDHKLERVALEETIEKQESVIDIKTGRLNRLEIENRELDV
jgi:hypothetical protein